MMRDVTQPTHHLDRDTRQYVHTLESAAAGKYTGDIGEVVELGTGLKPFQFKDNWEKIQKFVKNPEDMPKKVAQGLANVATKNHVVQTGKDIANVINDPGKAKNWGKLAMHVPMVGLGVATGKFFGKKLGKIFGGKADTSRFERQLQQKIKKREQQKQKARFAASRIAAQAKQLKKQEEKARRYLPRKV